MGRIIDKIHARQRADHPNTGEKSNSNFFYSFEFFPPATEAGLDNLLTRIERMSRRLEPLFIDVTYGSPSTAARSLAVASYAQKYLGVDVLLHITTVGASRQELVRVLEQAKASGIVNVLALRGDPPKGQRSWKPNQVSGGFCDRAIDLVRLVREEFGDTFGIAVAGHPEKHPSSASEDEDIKHLKKKIEAGADFVLSQFFYSTSVFLDFVRKCRAADITCPIIPGILPIQSFSSCHKMTTCCNVSVPDRIWKLIEPVKGDDEAVKNIGCDIAVEMCEEILAHRNDPSLGNLDGVHFYTLNLERSVTNILVKMGAVVPCPSSSPISEHLQTSAGRALPWRQSTLEGRAENEQVRPINWANRPKSYVMRTEDWDEFPNGRWGDSSSPAFGELSNMGHFFAFSLGSEENQRAMLGENPKVVEDVYEVFAKYVEGKIPHIPWCETPLQPESFLIQSQLAELNRAGFLTINSQPSVNGVPSTDETFGWGGPGGRIYQKAYVECFCNPANAELLRELAKSTESLAIYAVNNKGEVLWTDTAPRGVTALTWGVFPNREILQPTVFDPDAFVVWAEEAYSLWNTMWLSLYDFDSDSYALLEEIRDTFYLCAIVDNDYASGEQDIWTVISKSARHPRT